jgi:hypothetical protein
MQQSFFQGSITFISSRGSYSLFTASTSMRTHQFSQHHFRMFFILVAASSLKLSVSTYRLIQLKAIVVCLLHNSHFSICFSRFQPNIANLYYFCISFFWPIGSLILSARGAWATEGIVWKVFWTPGLIMLTEDQRGPKGILGVTRRNWREKFDQDMTIGVLAASVWRRPDGISH